MDCSITIRPPFGKPVGCCPDCLEGKLQLSVAGTTVRFALCECLALKLVEKWGGDSDYYTMAIDDLRGWFFWRGAYLRRKHLSTGFKHPEGAEHAKAYS